MSIVDRFRAAVDLLDDPVLTDPALLPTRLSRACVQVLPIAGAGLSVFSAPTMRLPIGASDTDAETAERLQFTVAQGCEWSIYLAHFGRAIWLTACL